jgi:hypothetical protein
MLVKLMTLLYLNCIGKPLGVLQMKQNFAEEKRRMREEGRIGNVNFLPSSFFPLP